MNDPAPGVECSCVPWFTASNPACRFCGPAGIKPMERRKHSAAFKRKVANWVIRTDGTHAAAAERFDVAPSVVSKWVNEAKQTKKGIRR